MKWVVFISQTGKELKSICEKINKTPNIVVTNNYKKLDLIVLEWIKENNITVVILPFNPTLQHYENLNLSSDCLITLHGFLRILPQEICKSYNIFNGHPGLITKYPELKGKDPQQKAHSLQLTTIGSVVHKVTPVVDDGEIIIETSVNISKGSSLEDYYNKLRETSLQSWVEFFKTRII